MSDNYSYSRLETFKQCPYKYKLIYLDGHRIASESVATEFGTLIHGVEERIGNSLKDLKAVDYPALISFFDSEIVRIRENYHDDFLSIDKSGRTYEDKARFYREKAIYRLEKRVREEGLKVIACEKEFYLKYRDYMFHGFIDRILMDRDNNFIVEDIKTYPRKVEKGKLVNPLQFVVYSLAMSSYQRNVECRYDLPLCDCVQTCRMTDLSLDDILEKIETSDFPPHPSPLCHWCVFSGTYPDQPEEAKNLCPYFSLWTRENKTDEVNEEWRGKKI